MSDYNYLEEVKADVLDYIENNIDYEDYDTIEDLENSLNDDLFVSEVTGNDSGSYTYSSYQAEENIAHNMDLLLEACKEFGCDVGEILSQGAESADVTIRCSLLGKAISESMDIIRDDFDKAHEDREVENI